MAIDLSIILPSIYPDRMAEFHQYIQGAMGTKSWELIIVGPSMPDYDLENTRFVQDWGNVSRCVQLGTMFARGKYLTWNSDDAHLVPYGYNDAINVMDTKVEYDGMIMRYYEAVGRNGQLPDDSYWTAWTHADQRLPGIPQHYRCCPVGMYRTEHYRWMGGVDCRFMHMNMNAHDLAFRIQNNSGEMHLSPGCIMECDFDNVSNPDHRVLDWAYAHNDRPLYHEIYSRPHDINRISIDYYNWMDEPSYWERFQ